MSCISTLNPLCQVELVLREKVTISSIWMLFNDKIKADVWFEYTIYMILP